MANYFSRLSFRFVSFIVAFIVSFRFVSFIASFRFVYRFVSFRFVSFRFVSFRGFGGGLGLQGECLGLQVGTKLEHVGPQVAIFGLLWALLGALN